MIAQINDYYFKLVKAKRKFIWHHHSETDEVFMVIDGELTMHLRDQTLKLKRNETVVIPKGVENKPSCTEECKVLLIEPTGTLNTGKVASDLSDTNVEWISSNIEKRVVGLL